MFQTSGSFCWSYFNLNFGCGKQMTEALLIYKKQRQKFWQAEISRNIASSIINIATSVYDAHQELVPYPFITTSDFITFIKNSLGPKPLSKRSIYIYLQAGKVLCETFAKEEDNLPTTLTELWIWDNMN